MNDVHAVDTTTTQLLDTLREATGRPDLAYAAPADALSGGYYAEMRRFRLADPPAGLEGDLVARIVPDPAAGAWEATVQATVAEAGFPTPAVRLTADATGPLGRYLIVMDAVDGAPPLAGLGVGDIVRRLPELLRHVPVRLAQVAADLHALDSAPLASRLEALDTDLPSSVAEVVEHQSVHARTLGCDDLADAAERLIATEPRSPARAITHADLHPFNLLVSAEGATLIDWTGARVAHPGYTVAFAHLVLGHPPIQVPPAAAGLLRLAGRLMAGRFLTAYRQLTDGTPAEVDGAHLEWHRKVHALRILIDVARWDVDGARPSGHPWLRLEAVARELLDLRPVRRPGGPGTGASR